MGYVTYSGTNNNSGFWGVRYPIYANDTATAALLQEWRDNGTLADNGILQDEATLLGVALNGMVVKTVNYDNSKQGFTVTGTMSNEDFINAWLAGDFVYTDQANRYGLDVNNKKGVIVTDYSGEAAAPVKENSDEAALMADDSQDTYTYIQIKPTAKNSDYTEG